MVCRAVDSSRWGEGYQDTSENMVRKRYATLTPPGRTMHELVRLPYVSVSLSFEAAFLPQESVMKSG